MGVGTRRPVISDGLSVTPGQLPRAVFSPRLLYVQSDRRPTTHQPHLTDTNLVAEYI